MTGENNGQKNKLLSTAVMIFTLLSGITTGTYSILEKVDSNTSEIRHLREIHDIHESTCEDKLEDIKEDIRELKWEKKHE